MTRSAQDSVHWPRRRNDLAARLLEAARRKHRLNPAAAAAWVIDELIPVLPAAETAGTQLWKRWTPAQDALLRRRWAEHVSAARIGAELGFSAGAVMGRAKRMDLSGRHMRRVG